MPGAGHVDAPRKSPLPGLVIEINKSLAPYAWLSWPPGSTHESDVGALSSAEMGYVYTVSLYPLRHKCQEELC